jgi:tetratricopeptide (TPR) repeat protein
VRLFVDRAAAVFAGFSLDEAVADSVAEVCRRVGGMPLAVELAAAQVAVFSVAQIAARIGRGPQGNGGAALPGQETIDASINWSYQLLDESERKIFEALSVFVGSFDVDAVEQLSEDGSAVRSFSNLVMKSLVLRDESDPGRYRLLEPLKQFAAARLEERGSASDVHALHTRMFAMLAAAAAPHLVGVAAPAWLARLDRDVENLRAALTWGFKAGGPHAHRAAAMAADIWMFWHLRGLMAEGRRWLEAALAVTGVEHHDLRVHVLFAAGVMAQGQGDFDAEVAWLSEALGIAESRNDPAAKCCLLSGLGGVAWARGDLDEAENYFAGSVAVGRPLHHWCASLAQAQRGRVAKDRGDFDVAVQLIQDGLGMARSIDFDMGIALALDFLAAVALARSDLDGASKLAHESLRHYRAIAYEEGIASVLQTIGRVAHWRGDDDGSTAAFGEVLVRCRQAGHRGGAAAGLEGVAAALAGRGPSGDAVQLFATASRLRGEIGAVPSQGDREQRDDILGRLRAELNTEFDVAWDLGSSLHLDEAIDLALRV